jgi:hypothetical protein
MCVYAGNFQVSAEPAFLHSMLFSPNLNPFVIHQDLMQQGLAFQSHPIPEIKIPD